MRIIGGRFRGLKLAELGAGDPAAHLRPTPDRVREAVFNLLEHGTAGNPVPGARVLDLFAGTGAMGCEALSRGAAHVVFVEDGAAGRALIRQNVERLRAQGVTRIWRRDATALGDNRDAPYGLVLMDPPYGQDLGLTALRAASEGGWLAAGAVIVWEEDAPQPAPAGFDPIDQRRYGASTITLLRYDPTGV